MKNVAAIYVRLSKEDLDSGEHESESIQNQKSMLFNYAIDHSWQIYNIYCDEDYSGAYSGADNKRPEFNRMIADASQKKFDIVLCKSLSRFSRNMEVIEKYIHGRFEEWGIRFVSLIDNADTDIKGNKKSRQINSLINEWYLEDLSENVKAVFKDKMLRGEFLASFPPYGYSKDKKQKNHLVVNPDTAPIVKQIFIWHSEGYGAAKISRMLNEKGIPTPRKQQELDGLRKTYMYSADENGRWSTTTVGDILNNQVYCGDVVQHTVEKVSFKSKIQRKVDYEDRIIINDKHEPIITREMFEETQERLLKRRKASGSGKVHILSGKVFCHYCGKPMQKNCCKSSKSGYVGYLRCRDKYSYAEKDRCLTPNIRIDVILQALQMQMIEQLKNAAIGNLDKQFIQKLFNKNSEKNNILKTELSRLRNEQRKISRLQKNLYSDRLNDVISVEEYLNYNKGFVDRADEISRCIDETERQLNKLDYTRTDENVKKELLSFFENKYIDREIIDSLVDRIEFGEINPETGNTMLKIFWVLV
ncbi:MAG: recombinase family protein [Oscillospiraceae bacterium]|nr:recombinase family protein [Oscillospiraceae bacterium]